MPLFPEHPISMLEKQRRNRPLHPSQMGMPDMPPIMDSFPPTAVNSPTAFMAAGSAAPAEGQEILPQQPESFGNPTPGLQEAQGIVKEVGNLIKNFNQGQQQNQLQQSNLPIGMPGLLGVPEENANAQEMASARTGGEVAQASGGGGLGQTLAKIASFFINPVATIENYTLFDDDYAAQKTASDQAAYDKAIAGGADPRFLIAPGTHTAESLRAANIADNLPPSAVMEYSPYGDRESQLKLAGAQLGHEQNLDVLNEESRIREKEANEQARLDEERIKNLWGFAEQVALPSNKVWNKDLMPFEKIKSNVARLQGYGPGMDMQFGARANPFRPLAEEKTARGMQSIVQAKRPHLEKLGYGQEETWDLIFDLFRQVKENVRDHDEAGDVTLRELRRKINELPPAGNASGDATINLFRSLLGQ